MMVEVQAVVFSVDRAQNDIQRYNLGLGKDDQRVQLSCICQNVDLNQNSIKWMKRRDKKCTSLKARFLATGDHQLGT
jgi:hypothetical protein